MEARFCRKCISSKRKAFKRNLCIVILYQSICGRCFFILNQQNIINTDTFTTISCCESNNDISISTCKIYCLFYPSVSSCNIYVTTFDNISASYRNGKSTSVTCAIPLNFISEFSTASKCDRTCHGLAYIASSAELKMSVICTFCNPARINFGEICPIVIIKTTILWS